MKKSPRQYRYTGTLFRLITMLLLLFSNLSYAEDVPNKNAEGMKKVHGVVTEIERVASSRRGSAAPTGILVVDLIEAIFGSNYSGFPIYHVKVDSNVALEAASRESFDIGDCVLVWYDEAMGDGPSLTMLGEAGMEKSNECTR